MSVYTIYLFKCLFYLFIIYLYLKYNYVVILAYYSLPFLVVVVVVVVVVVLVQSCCLFVQNKYIYMSSIILSFFNHSISIIVWCDLLSWRKSK